MFWQGSLPTELSWPDLPENESGASSEERMQGADAVTARSVGPSPSGSNVHLGLGPLLGDETRLPDGGRPGEQAGYSGTSSMQSRGSFYLLGRFSGAPSSPPIMGRATPREDICWHTGCSAQAGNEAQRPPGHLALVATQNVHIKASKLGDPNPRSQQNRTPQRNGRSNTDHFQSTQAP